MEVLRLRLVYVVLVPALVLAACVLAYFAYQTARQFERLGEQSIAESSLLLLQDKSDRIEQFIISADNQAFAAVEPDQENSLRTWKANAEEISPSIRALIVLNQDRTIRAFAARVATEEQQAFEQLFKSHVLKDLELDDLAPNRLKHLHRTYDGKSHLYSYKAAHYEDQVLYLVARHDIGYLMREVFAAVLRSDAGQPNHNIVDQDGRGIFGTSLVESGDYVVGRRFPTTLYQWRVQVAPTAAPLLEQKRTSSRVNQLALLGVSVAIIFIAVGFILYAAAKERRVAELKSDFIATVSHELKTPLSVIRMFGEMMVTGRVPDARKQQEYLEIICSESERLGGLIENVLDFAALERGKRKYSPKTCDLSEIAKRAIETMHYRFEREGIEVTLEQRGEPAFGSVDEQALLLVVINLLDNALKYGGGTPVHVLVETMADDVHLSVRDHGPGIATADRRRVFERFYRSKDARKARGSGIGLSIVKRVAEEHHGRAWVDTALDGGALVTVAIPRREPTLVTATHPAGRPIDSDPTPDIVAHDG